MSETDGLLDDILDRHRKKPRKPSRPGAKSCYQCIHLGKETESWEMPHIWWWECLKHPAWTNLSSFPFLDTKCPDHEKQKAP